MQTPSLLSLTLVAALTLQTPGAAQTASPELLRRALDPNPTLRSYVASATLSVELHAAVPVRKTFQGTAYYRRPAHKIVFENVPWPWTRFKALASMASTYAEVTSDYAITPLVDDGNTSTYALASRKRGGRVKSLTVTVGDRQALIVRAVWVYTGGGTLSFAQTYLGVGVCRVLSTSNISARFPQYSVDGTLQLSNYRLDARVPASVFAEES